MSLAIALLMIVTLVSRAFAFDDAESGGVTVVESTKEYSLKERKITVPPAADVNSSESGALHNPQTGDALTVYLIIAFLTTLAVGVGSVTVLKRYRKRKEE